MAHVSTGVLSGGSPYLAIGDGPPLVMVQGLTPTHEVPSGLERRMVLSSARSFSTDRSNALPRPGVPRPSITTTANPWSANHCEAQKALCDRITRCACGPP